MKVPVDRKEHINGGTGSCFLKMVPHRVAPSPFHSSLPRSIYLSRASKHGGVNGKSQGGNTPPTHIYLPWYHLPPRGEYSLVVVAVF